jgi:hypothetical protein
MSKENPQKTYQFGGNPRIYEKVLVKDTQRESIRLLLYAWILLLIETAH